MPHLLVQGDLVGASTVVARARLGSQDCVACQDQSLCAHVQVLANCFTGLFLFRTEVTLVNGGQDSESTRPFYIGPIGDRNAKSGTPERERYELAVRALENIVKRACDEVGIEEPLRSDMISQAGEVPEQVFRHLRDDAIVIADLTDGNANVMYELGMRHTKDKLTILLAERGKRPFNISVIRSIEFIHTEGGYIDGKNEVRKLLEEGLQGRYQPVTATRIWNEPLGGAVPTTEPTGPVNDGGQGEPVQKPEDPKEEEKPGWLEVWADAEDSFPKLVEAMTDIGAVMEAFTIVAKKGQTDLEANDKRQGGSKGKLIVAIQFAERLDEPLDRMDEIVSRYLGETTRIEPAIEQLLDRAEAQDFDFEDAEEVEALCVAMKSMVELEPHVTDFVETILDVAGKVGPLKSLARPVAVRVKRLETSFNLLVSTSKKFLPWAERARPIAEELCR